MRTAVWYDAGCDVIWISSHEEPFAPRTLRALLDDAGRVHIRRVGQTKTLAGGACTDFTDGAGFGFLSTDEALIYLGEVFGRRPDTGDLYSVGVAIAERGQTVIPLGLPPGNYASLRLVVNGVEYRAPDIAVSPVAVTWLADAFPLDPSDRVTVVYS